jgi:hypothetical protein
MSPIWLIAAACSVEQGHTDSIDTNSIEVEPVAVESANVTDPAPTGSAWSNPATWPSGHVPAAGENVTIPQGSQILLDVSPPALGGVTIEGSLIFAEKDLNLSAKWIMLHGKLQVGTENRPFPNRANITLTATDTNESVMNMGTRGILVMGGTLELHGRTPSPAWTKLSASTSAQSTSLSLVDSVSWSSGDQLAVAPTDFYRVGATEQVDVSSASGTSVTLKQALQKPRWGKLQYIDSKGVTLTANTSVTSKVLDERAEVGNLTRNIVIQGQDDSLWRDHGFGGQVMFMSGGIAHIDGAQFRRMGQASHVGRYPIHWHLWSYNSDGTVGNDTTGQYVRNSVVWGSSQRCMVIHATNGLTIKNNICYDIKGHAFFLEDAVERRNVFDGNLVLHVRAPASADKLLNNELVDFRSGPSGFWLTNPDNTVKNNAVADSEGLGYWLAYPAAPLGLNKKVNMQPSHLPFGTFDNNVTHSNNVLGFQIDRVPIDDAGNTTDQLYVPYVGGFNVSNAVEAPFTISRVTSYKHEGFGALWNRARNATYTDFIVADHAGTAFQGASTSCLITNALVVGTTLNNATALSSSAAIPRGAASYHSQCDITKNVWVNLPAVAGKESGVFETFDYYITGVDKGLWRNVNNVFVNSHPGFRSTSLNTLNPGSGHENWALAGALWDPQGLWGAAGNYWVYDQPFFTTGTSCTDTKQPVHHNDKSCVGPYYGFDDVHLDGYTGQFTNPIQFKRNENGATWFIDDGKCTWRLGPMRNASLVKNGSFTVSFPNGQYSDDRGTCTSSQLAKAPPTPHIVQFKITNLLSASDGFMIAIPYTDKSKPTVFQTTWANPYEVMDTPWDSWTAYKKGDSTWASKFRGQYWRPLTAASSLSDAQNSNGTKFYQDKSAKVVWVSVRGGLASPSATAGSDTDLYRPNIFVLDDTI